MFRNIVGTEGFPARALGRAVVAAVIVLAMLSFATPARAASFTVNDLGDAPDAAAGNGACADSSGKCTLRAAIDEANAMAGDDTIGFVEGSSGTITLANGELRIQSNLAIAGPGADELTVSGADKSRIFNISPDVNVGISGLTIANGRNEENHGDSEANGLGGGIYNNEGELTVESSTINDNYGGLGGGIYTEGPTTLKNSTLSRNRASDGGGIYLQHEFGDLTVQNSTINANSATGVNLGHGPVQGYGGGIYGVRDEPGPLKITVQNSTINANSAIGGIGIYNLRASLAVENSTISGNTPISGYANHGGAIKNEGGAATVENSTISGNRRDHLNGGITNVAFFIHRNPDRALPGMLTVLNSTVTDNGGIDIYNDGQEAVPGYPLEGRSTVEVGNSIIATEGSAYDVLGPFTSLGYNLIGDASLSTGFTNGVNGDKTGTTSAPLDPKLGPLADNGGPTRTHALLSNSPAIDAGNPAFASPPEFDQRGEGFLRKQGTRLDIGAFEVQPNEGGDTVPPRLDLPADITEEATGPRGATVNFNATAQDDTDGSVTANCSPASGSTFPLGTTPVNCSVTDAAGNEATGSFNVTVQDTTPPEISGMPSDITKTATSSSGATVSYQQPTAADVVDGTVPVNCAPASGSTFALGNTTVNCSASDSRNNAAQKSFQVDVTYSWSGVLKPINPDGSSVFRLRVPVPVKFQLTGESAGITDATAKLYVAEVTGGVVGSEVEANSAAATTGNLFRYDAPNDQYVFNWDTKGLDAGTYQLRIDLGDGTTNTVRVSLR